MVEAAGEATGLAAATHGRRRRRSYSEEEKRRMVMEASQPGASVADIARRHGVNANLLFNWRRLSRGAASGEARSNESAQPCRADARAAATEPPAFIPLGMFGRAEDEGPALMAGAGAVAGGQVASARATAVRPALEDRAGTIEIELGDGTRLRVDAFVNERALRRVLAAVKATS